MKIIILVDTIPALELFLPILNALPATCEVLFINYYSWNVNGRKTIDQALQKNGLKTIAYQRLNNVEKLLKEEAPNVIVLSRDTTNAIEQSFIELAKCMNIPTLLVPHGIWAPEERKIWTIKRSSDWLKHLYALGIQGQRVIKNGEFRWSQLIQAGIFWMNRDLKRKPVFDGHGGCSNIAVFGQATKDLLVSEGINPERITVTGNPKFDLLYQTKSKEPTLALIKQLGISNNQNIILLLTDYLVESGIWTAKQRIQFVMAIITAVNKLPACKLVNENSSRSRNESDYLEIIHNIPQPPVICKTTPLPELLNVCKIAITLMSTAGLEAMAMDKPLVVVNLFNNITPFGDASGALIVRKEADLLPVLQMLIRGSFSHELKKSADKYVYDQAYVQDGEAATRIADLIIRLSQCRQIS